MGTGAAPLDVASLGPGPRQVTQRPLVVALKLADARELPLRRVGRDFILRVRRVSQLAARAAPHGDLLDDVHQTPRLDLVPERLHEVAVGLQRRSAVERLGVVRPERDALGVSVAVLVGEEQIRVLLRSLQHPLGQRDAEVVPHVRPARVERHHRVELQVSFLHHAEELDVRLPVVQPRPLALDDAPPHVDHHTLHANLFQRLERHVERLHVLQLSVAGDDVQGQHDEDRRGRLGVGEVVHDGKPEVPVEGVAAVQHGVELELLARGDERLVRVLLHLALGGGDRAGGQRGEVTVSRHLLRQRRGEVVERHEQVGALLGGRALGGLGQVGRVHARGFELGDEARLQLTFRVHRLAELGILGGFLGR